MSLSDKKTAKNLEKTKGIHGLWGVLIITTGAQMSISFIALGVASLVPFFVRDLGISLSQAGFLGGAVNIGTAFTVLMAGILVDRLGEKKVLITGGILTGLTVLMASRTDSFSSLVLMLLLIGFWTASAAPAGSKGIISWVPEVWRGFALGFRQIGQPLGGSLAAVILPALALTHGWQGALKGASLSAFAGVLLVMFFYREKTVEKDLLKDTSSVKQEFPKLLRNKGLWLITLNATTLVGIQFTVLGYLELFIHASLGYPIRFASYMLALASMTGMFGRIFWGIISDRIFGGKRKKPFLIVSVLTGVICLFMVVLHAGTSSWIVAALSCLAGFTANGWSGLFVVMVSELAGRNLAGTALGFSLTVAQLGVLSIPSFFGFLVDHTGSYTFGWVMLAVISLVGAALMGRVREKPETVTGTFSS